MDNPNIPLKIHFLLAIFGPLIAQFGRSLADFGTFCLERSKGRGSGCTTAYSGTHRYHYRVYCRTSLTSPCSDTKPAQIHCRKKNGFQNSACVHNQGSTHQSSFLAPNLVKMMEPNISMNLKNCVYLFSPECCVIENDLKHCVNRSLIQYWHQIFMKKIMIKSRQYRSKAIKAKKYLVQNTNQNAIQVGGTTCDISYSTPMR